MAVVVAQRASMRVPVHGCVGIGSGQENNVLLIIRCHYNGRLSAVVSRRRVVDIAGCTWKIVVLIQTIEV